MLKNLKLELASLDDLEDIAHIYEDIHTDLEQTDIFINMSNIF